MTLRKVDYGTIAALAVSIVGGAVWLGGLDARVDSVDTRVSDINIDRLDQRLNDALEQIEKAKKDSIDQLPVGTVIASVFEPTIFLSNGNNKKWELADGSSIPIGSEYSEFMASASTESNKRLPDLRGMFIRGMNEGRDDGKQDPQERSSGSYQEGTTALPKTPYIVSVGLSGNHTHNYDHAFNPKNNDWKGGGSSSGSRVGDRVTKGTTANGEHSHGATITGGGDSETRPNNVSLYYYIKVN